MLDPWTLSPTDAEASLSELESRKVAKRREPFYSHAVKDLLTFQATLSCTQSDAKIAASALVSKISNKENLAIMDIGGAEGRFCGHFLAALKAAKYTIGSIHNIDPAPQIQSEYSANVTEIADLTPKIISNDRRGVEEAALMECDILVASHSLYAMVEKSRKPGAATIEGQLRRLVTSVRLGGAMLVVMSSENSMAIVTKRKIYRHLFGGHCFDTVAEDIEKSLITAGHIESRIYSDTLIDLTESLGPYKENGFVTQTFKDWASYFLRHDVAKLPERHVRFIADMFLASSFELKSLPENFVQHETSVAHLALTSDSIVLPHKSLIYVVKPFASTNSKSPISQSSPAQ